MKNNIERVYHNYKLWEDFKFGMFETTCFMDAGRMISDCRDTLACEEWLYECMMFVSTSWRYSSEHNLTNTHRNRQAWLGQASCAFAHGAPEYITKQAWYEMTDDQKSRANDVADSVIVFWEDQFKNKRLEWQS